MTDTIGEFMRRGVIIRTVINNMTFDGSATAPVQQAVRDALIAFMAATAQAQAEVTKEAQKAGIEAAKRKLDRYRGRMPSYTREQLDAVESMLSEHRGVSEIAKAVGLSRQTVCRIRENPAQAFSALESWGSEPA